MITTVTAVALVHVSFVVLSLSKSQEITANFKCDKTFQNLVLNHGLIFEINRASRIYCASRCIEDHLCISFNFHHGTQTCRGYETLMLARDAGTYEEGWLYYFHTINGFCPNMYAFSRLYNYCLGYEGQFLAADGFNKCQEKSGQLLLIRGEAEMRFASLLAANFKNLSRLSDGDLMIQGSFDNTDIKWKDDIQNILPFTAFLPGKEIPTSTERYLYLRKALSLESYVMHHRKGETYKAIVVCMVN